MRIAEVTAQPDWVLMVVSTDGRTGYFDVKPYLAYEAFAKLSDPSEFQRVSHGGYFIEWACGADLSADTIEAHWKIGDSVPHKQPV
jgi:hypothetical protein